MQHKSAVEKWLRTITQRHDDVKSRLHDLRNALARHDDENKKQVAERALVALSQLWQMFHDQDRPQWMNKITESVSRIREADNPANMGEAANNFLSNTFNLKDEIFSQSVTDQASAAGGINFEAVYTAEYRASQVPALFDRLIELLENVIASGELDSVRAINALQALIDLLKKNKNSSYPTAQWAMQISGAAALNILYRFAESVPVLGPIIQGIDDTIKQANVEWGEVRDRAAQKIRAAFPVDLPALTVAAPPPLGLPPAREVIAQQAAEDGSGQPQESPPSP